MVLRWNFIIFINSIITSYNLFAISELIRRRISNINNKANKYFYWIWYMAQRYAYVREGWAMECLWFTLGVKFLVFFSAHTWGDWNNHVCTFHSSYESVFVPFSQSLLFMGMNATCWPQTWIDRRTYWCKPLYSLIIRFMLHYTHC